MAASQIAEARAAEATSAAQAAESAAAKSALMVVAKLEEDQLNFYDTDGACLTWDDFDQAEAAGKAIFVSIPPLPDHEIWGSILASATNYVRQDGELISFDLIGSCVRPDPDNGTAIGGTFYLPFRRGDDQIE